MLRTLVLTASLALLLPAGAALAETPEERDLLGQSDNRKRATAADQ